MRQQGDLLKLLSAAYVLAPPLVREHLRRAIELCKDEEGPPLTRRFIASVMRGVMEQLDPEVEVQKRLEDARREAHKAAEELFEKHRLAPLREKVTQLELSLHDAERVAGVRLFNWDSAQMTRAIHALTQAGDGYLLTRFRRAIETLDSELETLREAEKALSEAAERYKTAEEKA
jgi:hypothetical protein